MAKLIKVDDFLLELYDQNRLMAIGYLLDKEKIMFCTKRWEKNQTQRGVPKFVAQFLNQENPDCYTGHALRRLSATSLVE